MEGISLNGCLFLIPILLIGFAPFSFAETEHYKNYDKEILQTNLDGSQLIQHKFLKYDRLFYNNNWVDFIESENQIQTSLDTVIVNSDGSYTWIEKGITDRIVAKYADISNLNSWTYPNTLNNDVPDNVWNGTAFVSTKNKSGVGNLNYVYSLNGVEWKTQLEATNLSSLTTKAFGFDEIFDIQSDTVRFGGVTRNLDNFNGTVFLKPWLDANKGKVIDLLNGVSFDFDKGYENLYSITVYDTGPNSSRLVFDYRTSTPLLPGQTLIIDPTYSVATASDGRLFSTATTSVNCSATYSTTDGDYKLNLGASGGSNTCQVAYAVWDLSTIPFGSTMTSGTIEYDTTAELNPVDCQFVISSTNTIGQQMYDDGRFAGAGVNATSKSSTCKGVADGKVENFLSSSFSTFESKFGSTMTLLTTTMTKGVTNARDALDRNSDFRDNDAELTITYYVFPPPDAVDDLTSPSQSYGSIDLLWTQPGLHGETCEGYQINYTTPWGNPNTIITNNTGTCTTSTTISGLSISTDYTFGVSVWTAGGNNATKPPMVWLNTTTAGNFTIGNAVFNQTNSQVLPITFEEQNINSTATFLNVTYANTYNMACDFYYQFANTNNTYYNLTGTAVSSTLDETYFILTDFENEIINIECYDQITGTDANYLMTQSDFPLLQQFANFRNGTYGTMGMFGAFDLITIAVVIFSMIGLNRVNESVGAVFNIILLGVLAYFAIIELPTIIFGVLTVVIIFVITSTRKD